ncbi:MAG: type II toxin-antitoxin system HicB family antitoxin [Actinobacteria bacterium]|nr:type II toxin-antitoxin system HicB family antitoxin [Actinomycetota bacterium]
MNERIKFIFDLGCIPFPFSTSYDKYDDTFDKFIINAKEAIGLYVKSLKASHGKEIPA